MKRKPLRIMFNIGLIVLLFLVTFGLLAAILVPAKISGRTHPAAPTEAPSVQTTYAS